MSESWIAVGAENQFPEGLYQKTIGKQRVVIARLQNKLYAFDALCPHAQGPMELSEIDGAVISCPLHAWRFDLDRAGCELHGYRSIATYPVRVSDGQVYLSLNS